MPNGIVTIRMKQMIPASAYPRAMNRPPKISQRTFSTKRIRSIMRVRRPVKLVDLGPIRQRAGRAEAAGGGGTGRARPPDGVDERAALTPADRERGGEGVPRRRAVHPGGHRRRPPHGVRVAAAAPGTRGPPPPT